MQWLLDNLVTIFVTVSGALSVMVGFLWNLDQRTRNNARDIKDLKGDVAEAKSARLELHKTVQANNDKLTEVAGDTQYIRGFLDKQLKRD